MGFRHLIPSKQVQSRMHPEKQSPVGGNEIRGLAEHQSTVVCDAPFTNQGYVVSLITVAA